MNPQLDIAAAEPAARRRRAGRNAGFEGKAAEDQTVRRYLSDGARLLARNWRAGRDFGGGEIC